MQHDHERKDTKQRDGRRYQEMMRYSENNWLIYSTNMYRATNYPMPGAAMQEFRVLL